MKKQVTWILIIVVAALIGLSAWYLQSGNMGYVTSTTTPTTASASPDLVIDSAVAQGNSIAVTVHAVNFNVPAQGHFHLYLDGDTVHYLFGPGPTFTFANVSAGSHSIRVELHNPDHTLVSPTVAKTASVSVSGATSTSPATTTSATSSVKSFTVHESSFKFDVSQITVNKGDTVQVTVINDGGTHNLAFPDFNTRTTINSGGSQTITFTADKTGTFQYYCEVGGHKDLGMVGTLTVQ